MLVTLAGEQPFAEQLTRAYQPAALPRTPCVRGQQLPDLGGVINQQHSLWSHPQRDRASAASHQHVKEVPRRAAEGTDQCQVHPNRPGGTGTDDRGLARRVVHRLIVPPYETFSTGWIRLAELSPLEDELVDDTVSVEAVGLKSLVGEYVDVVANH